MMKKYLYLTAIFMICLILSLPVYSASVLAGLENIGAYGKKDNIRGYMRDSDNVIVRAEATPDTITRNEMRVSVSGGGSTSFDSCVDAGNYALCRYESKEQIPGIVTIWTATLLGTQESKSAIMIKDSAQPQSSLEINPGLVSPGQQVNINYDVQDYADTYTNGECSGIKKLEFYANDNLVETLNINSQPNNCIKKGTITKTASQLGDEGIITIMLKAYDNFDFVSESFASFTIDAKGPSIEIGSFRIKNNGNNVTGVGANGIKANISINMTGDDLNKSSVKADLSGLNFETALGERNADYCSLHNQVYECSWDNIYIKLNADFGGNIKITAHDNLGNIATANVPYTIGFDDTKPIIDFLGTNHYHNEQSYIGANENNIIARISESGSGFNNKNIWVDLGELGYGTKQADECLEDSGWECYWYNIETEKTGTVNIKINKAEDDAGNTIDDSSVKEANIIIDKENPVVDKIEIESLEHDNYIASGDDVSVKAEVIDTNPVFGFGNFSRVKNEASGEVECTEEDSVWVCEWSIGDVAYSENAMLEFTFNDAAGNSIKANETINVFLVEDNTEPDYWYVGSTSNMPSSVDRQTTSYVEQKVYTYVKLVLYSSETETLDIGLIECSIDPSGYVTDYDIINNEPGSTDPYLKFSLSQTDMDVDNIEISCEISIVSKINQTTVSYPETETIDITIEFYNMPLGEVGENLDDKIDEAREDACEGVWGVIGTLEDFVHYSEMLCKVLDMFTKILVILRSFNANLEVLRITPETTGIAIYGCWMAEGAEIVGNNLVDVLNIFCDFVSCEGADLVKHTGDTGFLDWLGDFQSNVEGFYSQLSGAEALGLEFDMDPKSNIYTSIVTLCIPGIIYNLNKHREVQCFYVDCLENWAEEGVPVEYCEQEREYLDCKYFYGGIFQAIPPIAFLDYIFSMVTALLSNPIALLELALNYICGEEWCEESNTGASFCNVAATIIFFADLWEDIQSFGEDWSVPGGYCDEVC